MEISGGLAELLINIDVLGKIKVRADAGTLDEDEVEILMRDPVFVSNIAALAAGYLDQEIYGLTQKAREHATAWLRDNPPHA